MDSHINNSYPPTSDTGLIDIVKFFRILKDEWKLILLVCVISAVVGVIIAFTVVSTYTVSTQLVPESTSKAGSGSSSSLASIASMAGINLGGLSSSDAISPDLYPEVVSSYPFLTDLFNVPVEFVRRDSIYRTTYYEYISSYQKSFKFSRGIPKKIQKQEFVDISKLTWPQYYVMRTIRRNIFLEVDKKSSIINVSVTDQNPEVAYVIAKAVVSNLKSYISSYRTEKARHDLAYYESLFNDAQKEYFDAQKRYSNCVDANQGVVRKSALVEQKRLQDEMQLLYSVYNSCALQVQTAKAQVQHETPVFVTVTPPLVPLQDNESGAKICAVSIFIGLALVLLWILLFRSIIEEIRMPDGEEKMRKIKQLES